MTAPRSFRLTPLWFATIVLCGLAIYVVVWNPERVSKISLGEGSIELGQQSLAGGDVDKAKALAGQDELIGELAQLKQRLAAQERRASAGNPATEGAISPGRDDSRDLNDPFINAPEWNDEDSTPKIDLSGVWQMQGGPSQYIVEGRGDAYTIMEQSRFMPGIPTAIAQGSFDGRTLRVNYQGTLGNTGSGELHLQPGGRALAGSLHDHVTGMHIHVVWVR